MKSKKLICLILAFSLFAHYPMSALNFGDIKNVNAKIANYIKEKVNNIKTKTKQNFNSVKNNIQENISKVNFGSLNLKKNAPYLIAATSALVIIATSLRWLFKKNTSNNVQIPLKNVNNTPLVETLLSKNIPVALSSKNKAIIKIASAIGIVSIIAALLLALKRSTDQNNDDENGTNHPEKKRAKQPASIPQVQKVESVIKESKIPSSAVTEQSRNTQDEKSKENNSIEKKEKTSKKNNTTTETENKTERKCDSKSKTNEESLGLKDDPFKGFDYLSDESEKIISEAPTTKKQTKRPAAPVQPAKLVEVEQIVLRKEQEEKANQLAQEETMRKAKEEQLAQEEAIRKDQEEKTIRQAQDSEKKEKLKPKYKRKKRLLPPRIVNIGKVRSKEKIWEKNSDNDNIRNQLDVKINALTKDIPYEQSRIKQIDKGLKKLHKKTKDLHKEQKSRAKTPSKRVEKSSKICEVLGSTLQSKEKIRKTIVEAKYRMKLLWYRHEESNALLESTEKTIGKVSKRSKKLETIKNEIDCLDRYLEKVEKEIKN